MKKALVLFIGFICYQIICHAQVMDEHYYQNFFENSAFVGKMLVYNMLQYYIF